MNIPTIADRDRCKAALKRNEDMTTRSRDPNALAVHEAWVRFYRQLLQVHQYDADVHAEIDRAAESIAISSRVDSRYQVVSDYPPRHV